MTGWNGLIDETSSARLMRGSSQAGLGFRGGVRYIMYIHIHLYKDVGIYDMLLYAYMYIYIYIYVQSTCIHIYKHVCAQ